MNRTDRLNPITRMNRMKPMNRMHAMNAIGRIAAAALACAALMACNGNGGGGSPDMAGVLTVDVSAVFPPGTALRDQYAGTATTVDPSGKVTLTPGPGGVVLLEKDGAAASPFRWGDVTVYFALTDRFANGDPSNDRAYGRKPDGKDEVGTFHGGDWKGITSKLDYLESMGVTAIWISPIVENVHGWVGGGGGAFRHYGYAGYWALDFTRLDQSWGSEADLQALIDAAHQRGIRVLVDVVLNHPGYATGADLLQYLPEVFFDKKGDAFKAFDQSATDQLNRWNELVNYNSDDWQKWWSPKWIRVGFPGFDATGRDDLTKSLAYLPDFKTEAPGPADAPILFSRKTDTAFEAQPGLSVRQYLVKWHSEWVRRLGIDGFRCDTAKHVELDSWKALKQAATTALADWKRANPSKKIDDAPFWMTGEVFPHGVVKDEYYSQGGFDSLLNFDFQDRLKTILQNGPDLTAGADTLDGVYKTCAAVNAPGAGFETLSYISSHDTDLLFDYFKNDPVTQRQAGTALLLAPGGVQIYYGDESGRRAGPSGGDGTQGTRSDMNWGTTDRTILDHWQKLAAFRKKHAAVGAGSHQRLASPPGSYAFARRLDGDDVVVVLARGK